MESNQNQSTKISLSQLHNQTVALTMERQDVFSELVEDLSWSFDMISGTVTFGDYSFRMQMLGTYSEEQQSWLWAWANKQSGIPEEFLQAALAMKEIGERNGIEDLVTAKIETDQDPGHYFSFVANGLIKSSCYAPLTFNNIKVYVLLNSELVDNKKITDPALICSHFAKTISRMDFGHKHGLFCYLNQKGYEVKLSEDTILGEKDKDQILGSFDTNGRLLKITNSKIETAV
ncbi:MULTISPECIES: DUF6882 domain-containing protein [Flavobacterium]|uniref:DUF6882 domain-containing protein n=1 Tax=Flavobacterium jumunjinense TaxID=998845 RepID=A0ABV5GP35_9FLAO|nr:MULTISPECIES: DUF6882 domain-containing protein [Flavobacterium]